MDKNFLGQQKNIVYVQGNTLLITNVASSIDLIMTLTYETQCRKVILKKELFCEDFFRLTTGMTGEILQKLVNYLIKMAMV